MIFVNALRFEERTPGHGWAMLTVSRCWLQDHARPEIETETRQLDADVGFPPGYSRHATYALQRSHNIFKQYYLQAKR